MQGNINIVTNKEYSLPGNYSPQKSHRRPHRSDTTETIQIGMAPHDATRGSIEYRDKSESTRLRQTPGGDGFRGGRSARYDRNPGDSFSTRAHSSRSRSPTKRSRSPDKIPAMPHSSTGESNLANRRNNPCPDEINVESARQYKSISKKAVVVEAQTQHQSQQAAMVPPATPPLRRMPKILSPSASDFGEDDNSSYYSEDEFGQAHPSYISPLRVRKTADGDNGMPKHYNAWGRSPSPNRMAQNATCPARSSQHHGLQKTATMGDLRDGEPSCTPRNYSPLSDYLSSYAMPARKQMVGAHGWLERTTKTPDKKTTVSDKKDAPLSSKKLGFLDNLRKIAKDVTSSAKDITSSTSRKSREKERKPSRLNVSLEPREQSLLYCELEFLLTTALDGYISSQFNAGRLDADKYKKTVDGWLQRGRPKVVGFRYDLETQLDLVMLHAEEFRFYGRRAGLLAAVNGVLDVMRVDARAMRIRTFCQPDTVIAKQLLDAQSLFNLIGCCEQQQIQLAEVIQFFKVILEREQNYRQVPTAAVATADRPDQEEGQQWRGSGGTGTGTDSHPSRKPQSAKNTTSPHRDYDTF